MILIESEAVELNHLSLQRKTLYARRFWIKNFCKLVFHKITNQQHLQA